MTAIPQHIVEQVHELERLRADGSIDDAWYLKLRSAIVRASRRAAADACSPGTAAGARSPGAVDARSPGAVAGARSPVAVDAPRPDGDAAAGRPEPARSASSG